MTLPVSGAISFNNINVELGVAGTTQASLGQASYRTLAGVPSGAISMSDFYGKSNTFSFTISSNQTNANLRSLAVAAGWNQSSNVVATINSGVYVSSNSTGTPALTVNGSFPGGVSLVNNGIIAGMGGAGGIGGMYSNAPGSAGSAGGLALSVSTAISITNNNIIAGGGGGGGGGQSRWRTDSSKAGSIFYGYGGGGGGGGRTGLTNSSGGQGKASTLPSSGYFTYYRLASQWGFDGTSSSAGAGGVFTYSGYGGTGGAGGSGGGWGSAGASGGAGTGGSVWDGAYGGGAAGGAVSGNANITWVATGTRYGGIA